MSNLDISPAAKRVLKDLLQRYLPDTEVWAYGSRVKGTSTATSDLDLVAFTASNEKAAVSELREAFDESNLPFRVDFFVWNEIPKEFHQQIKENHVVLQKPVTKNQEPTILHASKTNDSP